MIVGITERSRSGRVEFEGRRCWLRIRAAREHYNELVGQCYSGTGLSRMARSTDAVKKLRENKHWPLQLAMRIVTDVLCQEPWS